MLNVLLTIIYGLLILNILVVIHEGGHFLVGKRCGIKINEFSVGFGPKLFGRKKGEIDYSLRALPLGGYVAFFGEDEEVDEKEEPRAFNNRPVWQRFLTVLAGPAVNIIFAWIVTVIVLVSYGDYVPTIVEVPEGLPAYEAGVEKGDIITMIDGKKIDFSMEFGAADINGKESIVLGVQRADGYHEFEIETVKNEEGRNIIGIQYSQAERKRFSFFEAVKLSFKWMYLIVVELLGALRNAIFGGAGISQMSGPVGTIQVVGEVVRTGFENILRILALLSINLGIVNLLPFPALDGGRLVMLVIEKIIGRKVNRKVEAVINLVGIILLFVLMFFLTYQDIARLIG